MAGAWRRRIAEAELTDGPLDGMQGVQPRSLQQTIAAHALEQFGIEVLQMRAAVQKEQLTGDHRHQRVIVSTQSIPPGIENHSDPGDLVGHSITAEDPPGQGEPLETAELVEVGEGAQQVGVRR